MEKDFILKGQSIKFSDVDVKQAAKRINPGKRARVTYYAEVEGHYYPVRQLLVEMLRKKDETMPDIITHQAISILRALGFRIIEIT